MGKGVGGGGVLGGRGGWFRTRPPHLRGSDPRDSLVSEVRSWEHTEVRSWEHTGHLCVDLGGPSRTAGTRASAPPTPHPGMPGGRAGGLRAGGWWTVGGRASGRATGGWEKGLAGGWPQGGCEEGWLVGSGEGITRAGAHVWDGHMGAEPDRTGRCAAGRRGPPAAGPRRRSRCGRRRRSAGRRRGLAVSLALVTSLVSLSPFLFLLLSPSLSLSLSLTFPRSLSLSLALALRSRVARVEYILHA